MGTVIVNGKRYEFSGRDITVVDGRVIVDGKDISEQDEDVKFSKLIIEGDVETLATDLSVEVRGNAGQVKAGGSIQCGNVKGKVKANGSVNCGSIGGDVRAGGSVNCGHVAGSVRAGGSINKA